MSEEAVETIRRANAAFNAGDRDALFALLDPEVEFVDHLPLPDVAQAARGTDEVRAVLDAWSHGFPGFEADVQEYVDLGAFIVCVTRWRFVSRDEGVELYWSGAEAYEVRDGKIAWARRDSLTRRPRSKARTSALKPLGSSGRRPKPRQQSP